MHKQLFKELSPGQRLGWYWASLVFGLCVVGVVAFSGALSQESSRFPGLVVVALPWLAGVVLLRIYIQQVENPADFMSIIRAGRTKK